MATLLYVHIGTHKTGTTAIQQYLSDHASELAAHGLLYPSAGRPRIAPAGHHLLPWSIKEINQKAHGTIDMACWSEVFNEIDSHNPDRAIISSEDFDGCSAAEVAKVRELTANYDVKIVLYLRNQLDYVISAYKQRTKMGRCSSSFRDFANEHIQRCNYAELFAKWASFFGHENLVVRIYDKQKNSPGIIADVLEIFGLRAYLKCELEDLRSEVNVSPQDEIIKLSRYINVLEGVAPQLFRPALKTARGIIVRKENVGRFAIGMLRPFLNGGLCTSEDIAWLRKETSAWNSELFEKYLDPIDRIYLEF